MWCLREYRFLWSHTTTTTTTTKSLQLCLTLCDPMDGSPPGSGILQARTLEWVAISFSNVWKWKVKVKLLSRVWLLATPWTVAHQAPPSMGFSRQECWSRVPLGMYVSVFTSLYFFKMKFFLFFLNVNTLFIFGHTNQES